METGDSSAALYFLAIIPPTPIYEQVHELKLIFSREYHSSHALNSPPHITIIPPFKISPHSVPALVHFLHENTAFFQAGEVSLDGFGCFFSPRVIYINPRISQQFTEARNQLLIRFYESFPQQRQDTKPFHPHLTVAFKDLAPAMFSIAWPIVSRMDFSASFRLVDFVLLKYESGRWVVFQKFPLTENRSTPR